MDKECGNIKVTETEDGYRIDITGKNLKEAMGCCCVPIGVTGKAVKVACCETEKTACCEPEKEK